MNSKNSPLCVRGGVFHQKNPKNPVAAMKDIVHILKSHQKKYEPNSSGKALFLSFYIYSSFSLVLCFSWDIHIVYIHKLKMSPKNRSSKASHSPAKGRSPAHRPPQQQPKGIRTPQGHKAMRLPARAGPGFEDLVLPSELVFTTKNTGPSKLLGHFLKKERREKPWAKLGWFGT